MDIKALAKEAESYIIDRRRHFHKHPELSFKEWETTKTIVAELEAMGLPVVTFPDYPGCIATLDSGKPGRTLMIRADIDALPVQEKSGFDYSSVNDGVMHACGHDTHIAMALGAAKVLCSIKDELKGKIKFLFQSGEEMGCGAKYYVENGYLDDVDAIFGMHIWATLESPYISVEAGNRMASMSNFTVRTTIFSITPIREATRPSATGAAMSSQSTRESAMSGSLSPATEYARMQTVSQQLSGFL